MNNPADNSLNAIPVAAWLAEGQSSQRDMLESLQVFKSQSDQPFNVIASHRYDRPEIFEFADISYCEPSKTNTSDDTQIIAEPDMPRWQFVLEHPSDLPPIEMPANHLQTLPLMRFYAEGYQALQNGE